MQIKVLDLESKLFAKTVINISEIDDADEIIIGYEALCEKFNPIYIYCTVEANEISKIQRLERFGFEFSEFRIHSYRQLNQSSQVAKIYPYTLEPVGEKSQLEKIKQILIDSLPDDRFFNDPLVDKDFARQRELINIEKSFHSWPTEFILGLFNVHNNKLIAFRSGAFINDKEVTFYLYGVSADVDKDQFSRILDHLCIDYLQNQGVRIINAVSTGYNTNELDRLILHHGFRVKETSVLLRKVV